MRRGEFQFKKKLKRFFQPNSMAMLTQNLAPPFSCRRQICPASFRRSSLLPVTIFPENYRNVGKKLRDCRATTEQTAALGASSPFAKEMERLSAKESLLLAVSYCTFSIFPFGFFPFHLAKKYDCDS